MNKGNILVVEDNILNSELIKDVLEAKGYEVNTAMDYDDMCACIDRRLPDLIIMDIQLPGMSGFAIVEKLKESEKTSKIPLIAITAYAMKGDEDRILSAGFSRYIPKPIDTRKLPDIIEEVLSDDLDSRIVSDKI